ncbi:MAG: 50S ribosomal protein L21e [Candidatus Marsarchaeota archaeon]|nr:50S ribosomal protein L21e [Candidatus Marsarchaeota archaeon]
MTKRSAGLFSGKTRNMARHHVPSKQSVSTYIKDFEVGDKVAIVPKGSVKNIPHPRYKGRIGVIKEKRGTAYVVEVTIMKAKRTLVVPAVHLDKA